MISMDEGEDVVTEKLNEMTSHVKSALPEELAQPKVAIICGSGLGGLGNVLEEGAITIPYSYIPHFPVTGGVKGHTHALKVGKLNGRIVIIFLGRFHGYEGGDLLNTTLIVRLVAGLNIPNLIITNAAGSVNKEKCRIGDFLVITDHISFPAMAGQNPLTGPNLSHFGPRFPSLHGCYYRHAYDLVCAAAEISGVPKDIIKRGPYCHMWGPSYETPLTIAFLKLLGGAAVGMSTAPEVITAAHCRQIEKIIAISLITTEPSEDGMEGPTHENVLAVAAARAIEYRSLVSSLVTLLI